MEDFSDWLQTQLNNRNWKKSDLARRSGVSAAQITRIIKREQQPGIESLDAFSHALHESPITLYTAAGLYKPIDIDESTIDRFRLLIKNLSPQELAKFERIGWLLVDLEEVAPPEKDADRTKK